MDIAIVTGAETPLGLHLIQTLVRQGYRVHGIGNNFSKVTFADSQFVAHAVDLTDLSAVSETVGQILAKEKSLDLLIHAIDVTPGAAFEKLPIGNLEAILKIGLLGPVMLTRLALPNLLRFRGQLINVIPANKSGSPASAVNALLEGGLREMNRALFDRARDAGLRVTNLVLRQNPEPDALTVKSSGQTHIDLEDVARSVEHLIDPNFANVPAELVLHPRCSAHSDQVLPEVPVPLDPYGEVVLPPKEYCPPDQPKIPTHEKERIDRTIPYTDDEMEEKIAAAIEDFEAHPERYEPSQQQDRSARKSKRQRAQKTREQGQAPASETSDASVDEQSQPSTDDANGEEGGKNKRRRGRRRSGRNRNREADSTAAEGATQDVESTGARESSSTEQSTHQEAPVGDSNNNSQPEPQSGSEGAAPSKPKRSSGRGRLRSELKKSLVSAEIEAQAEFLPKVDARPQRRGRSRPESRATQNEAKSSVSSEPRPKLITSPAELKSAVGVISTPADAPAEVVATASEKESKPAAKSKKKAVKKAAKKATKKSATKKAAVVASDASEGASAVKKVAAKKAGTKKAAKKTAKKAAKKATKKSATKKAAKKKVTKKKAAKTTVSSDSPKTED